MPRGPLRRDQERTAARVRLLPDPTTSPVTVAGPVRSVQEAEVELPREMLERLWRPEYLERLARSYWRYLSRISLGLLRVVYEPDARTVVLVTPRLPLLRFRRPQYVTAPELGQVTWPIERGVLVARSGRGRGCLRITVRRAEDTPETGKAALRVRAEVSNFYPLLRGRGRFARFGVLLYSATQVRIHVLVTHGFLRSLARLDLPPSPVGALAPGAGADADTASPAQP